MDNSSSFSGMTVRSIVQSGGIIEAMSPECFQDSGRGDCTWKTIISSPSTRTDSITIGIASCKAPGGHLGLHRHQQPEVYYIISGQGLVEIDGEQRLVTAGSVVFIASNVEHGMRNLDSSEDLKWLFCFGANGFDEVIYQFTALTES